MCPSPRLKGRTPPAGAGNREPPCPPAGWLQVSSRPGGRDFTTALGRLPGSAHGRADARGVCACVWYTPNTAQAPAHCAASLHSAISAPFTLAARCTLNSPRSTAQGSSRLLWTQLARWLTHAHRHRGGLPLLFAPPTSRAYAFLSFTGVVSSRCLCGRPPAARGEWWAGVPRPMGPRPRPSQPAALQRSPAACPASKSWGSAGCRRGR